MFEIILILVIGAIVVSVIQGVRRGNVSPEERLEKPTLLENLSAGLDDLLDASERALLKTKADAQQGQWFRTSQQWIGTALESAKRKEATCREIFGSEKTEQEAISKFDETMATVSKAFADAEDIHHG